MLQTVVIALRNCCDLCWLLHFTNADLVDAIFAFIIACRHAIIYMLATVKHGILSLYRCNHWWVIIYRVIVKDSSCPTVALEYFPIIGNLFDISWSVEVTASFASQITENWIAFEQRCTHSTFTTLAPAPPPDTVCPLETFIKKIHCWAYSYRRTAAKWCSGICM